MAKQLNAEQKTISQIFDRANFLIPDYQRSYSWEREQCETLWQDLCNFAFPNGNKDDFDAKNDRYFLGTILTFPNEDEKSEVIDGQQRLITFLLMLRAFYAAFGNMQDDASKNVRKKIEQCIWHTDEDENPDKSSLKLESEVASDEDVAEFKKILATGEFTKGNTSNYAQNYRDFQKWIDEFKANTPDYFSYLPRRILNNCIILPIEADSQDTALRIFTTLNDRGLPLSDADIFKAQFYKFYKSKGDTAKKIFVQTWKVMEETCNKIFHPRTGTSLDDLFMRYMYYVLAENGITNTTLKGLRKFYETDNYSRLRNEDTFEDLLSLVDFWNGVYARDDKKFSDKILKRLYVLEYAPYIIWAYATSVYFLKNCNSHNKLDDEPFYDFLNKLTAFVLAYAVARPGVAAIRLPMMSEMVNILEGKPLEFKDYKFDEKTIRAQLEGTRFSNQKAITRAILAWWTFQNDTQELPPLGMPLEIEHIYAKKRHELHPLQNPKTLEFLGNKTLLEKRINIRAADYRFDDKKISYLGDGKSKEATFNLELRELAETHNDFTEEDIIKRNEQIFDAFIEYLRGNNLLL